VAAYHIIGLDPRGSGASTPALCETLDDVELPADVRDRSRENRAQLRSFAQAYLNRCLEPAGDLVRYVNTSQTIRDLDLLRALLGEERISYYGYSAGTWLGAWYAGEFPQRVDRFVLDGNIDFTSSWYELTSSWPRAVQRKFETDFLPWIAQYDETYGYGSSAKKAMATWEARRAALVTQPLVVSPGCTIRATDFDQTTWTTLGFDGVGGPGFLELGQGLSILERFDEATAEERHFVNDFFECLEEPASFEGMGPAEIGTTCGDTPSPDYTTYAKDSEQLGRRYPLLGWLAETLSGSCAFWPFPVTEKPRLDGNGLPPILMVNNDRDPLTPIEGARHAAAKLKSARLLVVENESHHTIYGLGNECADGYIDRFLLTGALPPRGATCEGLPSPDPTAASSRASAAGAGRSALARGRLRSLIGSRATAG
jgi:pimeloyl-ACP methyl ester carboxylesterase